MAPLEAHEEGRLHLIGAPRHDLIPRGAATGTTLGTTKTALGTPTLHCLETYIEATLMEISRLMSSDTGVWAKEHADHAYHVAKIQLVAMRSVFIIATVDNTMHYMQKQIPFAQAWDYLTLNPRCSLTLPALLVAP